MKTRKRKNGLHKELRCPLRRRWPGDITGCGSLNIVGPDDEGFYDCPDCGLFFKAYAGEFQIVEKK